MKKFLCIFLLLFLLISCVSAKKNYSVQDDFPAIIKQVKRIGIVVYRVDIFERGAGGGLTFDQEESFKAKNEMQVGAIEAFKKAHFEVKLLDNSQDIEGALNSLKPIYSNIRNQFPDGQMPVTQTIKMLNAQEICKTQNVDIIAVIRGRDQIQSKTRMAINAARYVALAMIGVGYAQMENASTDIILIDATGRPVFYSIIARGVNITYTGNAEFMVSEMIDEMKKGGKI